MNDSRLHDRIYGCLLGGLIGDAMGAPAEGKSYLQLQEQFGQITDFEGVGTDDTIIKHILADAIFESGGHVTADEFALSFLKHRHQQRFWWTPVQNMFHKLLSGQLPAYAGVGNNPSSSSAMAIAPMGILNACDPRRAARETYEVAGLIHSGPEITACRDAACGMAAATAEALKPDATVESVSSAALRYLHADSAREIRGYCGEALALALEAGEYERFRELFYGSALRPLIADARETFPATLALFSLSGGDFRQAVVMGANFGRDADTIAGMVGGLAGALGGASSIPPDWVARVEAAGVGYQEMTRRFIEIIRSRREEEEAVGAQIKAMLQASG
jgi:ADP-ribosylglycohydrolase